MIKLLATEFTSNGRNMNTKIIDEENAPKIIQRVLRPYFLDQDLGFSVKYPVNGSFIMFHIANIP